MASPIPPTDLSSPVTRIALFAIRSPAHLAAATALWEAFTTPLPPYLVSATFGAALHTAPATTSPATTATTAADAAAEKAKGYTFAAVQVFRRGRDVRFYEEGCERHEALKRGFREAGVVVEGGGVLSLVV